MKPGGCDKTQQMIDEWSESVKDLREDSTPSQMSNLDTVEQGVMAGPLGEDLPTKKKKIKKEEYGAGFDGTSQLVQNYARVTPGAVHTIKRVMRDKYKRKRKLI